MAETMNALEKTLAEELSKVKTELVKHQESMKVMDARTRSYQQTTSEILGANIELKTGISLLQQQVLDANSEKAKLFQENTKLKQEIEQLKAPRMVENTPDMPAAANGN